MNNPELFLGFKFYLNSQVLFCKNWSVSENKGVTKDVLFFWKDELKKYIEMFIVVKWAEKFVEFSMRVALSQRPW